MKPNVPTPPPTTSILQKRIITGASIALLLITVFILPSILNPKPDWGNLWMIRPLLVVPIAGGLAAAIIHVLLGWQAKMKWPKLLVYFVCLLGYIIALWMGTVVGLDGTLWD
ncbi:hypothetical protein [Phnomibacter sp. MR]|uniref:hypothetical protein n=1 Tax=Phnomibacter sp. MR TaxID=3042318 RepID=UPI003A801D18